MFRGAMFRGRYWRGRFWMGALSASVSTDATAWTVVARTSTPWVDV